MSKTYRRNKVYASKEVYKARLMESLKKGWESEEGVQKKLSIFGTDTDNWDSNSTTALKKHSNSWRRAWERDQLSKSYKDWENEFDPSVDKLIKELWWVYF